MLSPYACILSCWSGSFCRFCFKKIELQSLCCLFNKTNVSFGCLDGSISMKQEGEVQELGSGHVYFPEHDVSFTIGNQSVHVVCCMRIIATTSFCISDMFNNFKGEKRKCRALVLRSSQGKLEWFLKLDMWNLQSTQNLDTSYMPLLC